MEGDHILEAIKRFHESEEGKRWSENFKKQETIREYQINRIKNMSIEDRYKFIHACIQKYNSKSYIERERKLGYYEPRESLYDLIFDYAVKYGEESCYDINEYFAEEQFSIDNKFVIGQIYGQGTIFYCKELPEDNPIIPHAIDTYFSVFDNNDNKIIDTNNLFSFIDICQQIGKNNISGYYFLINDKGPYDIDKNGKFNTNLLLSYSKD